VTVIEGRLKPHREFEIVGMDLLKLPESVDGFVGALVVVDHFTRFAWVRPIRNKEARTVLSAYVSIDMPLCPTLLVSDNGVEFKNKAMSDYCEAFGIRQHFCTPYHPQSDGVVERFNRSLIAMLRAYVNESGDDWPGYLNKVVSAYNSMVHPSTGVAPYRALFKIDKEVELVSLPELRDVYTPSEFEQLREWMRSYMDITHEHTDESNNRHRLSRIQLKVGDLVMCRDYMVRRSSAKAR
jgi:transposase InsO family protein